MFHAHEFWFKTAQKVLDSAKDVERDKRMLGAVVVFVHAEAEDAKF